MESHAGTGNSLRELGFVYPFSFLSNLIYSLAYYISFFLLFMHG